MLPTPRTPRPLTVWMILCGLTACQRPGYHEDVRPILEGRCNDCHTDGAIAPFSLDSYTDASTYASMVADAVSERAMPPWSAVEGHRDYLENPSLTEAQIEIIQQWADHGAPEGNPDEPGEPLPTLGSELEEVSLTLQMPEAYTPQDAPDDYRCFVLDWPEAETTWLTGFQAAPGNTAIVHHLAAFLFSPNTVLGDSLFEALEAWDEADEGPGYTCFGGPSGAEELQVPIQQLAQWVPGMGALPFPEGTGIEIPPDSKVVLQVHYYVTGDEPGSDQTALDLALASEVEHAAAFAPWLDANWTLGDMDIPAGREVSHDVQRDPRSFFELVLGDMDLDAGFDIHSVLLHMHRLGTKGWVSLERASGESEVLLEVNDYDFDWQMVYRFTEPVRFEDGDELLLECTWDNSEGSEDVNWGEGTDDEMCVGNMFISEL